MLLEQPGATGATGCHWSNWVPLEQPGATGATIRDTPRLPSTETLPVRNPLPTGDLPSPVPSVAASADEPKPRRWG